MGDAALGVKRVTMSDIPRWLKIVGAVTAIVVPSLSAWVAFMKPSSEVLRSPVQPMVIQNSTKENSPVVNQSGAGSVSIQMHPAPK